jgi:hypothetical protein
MKGLSRRGWARRPSRKMELQTMSGLCLSWELLSVPVGRVLSSGSLNSSLEAFLLICPEYPCSFSGRDGKWTAHSALQMGLFSQHDVLGKVRSQCLWREQVFLGCMELLLSLVSQI